VNKTKQDLRRKLSAKLMYKKASSGGWCLNPAKTMEEACKSVEAGFEYVTDMDNCKPLRKPR